MIDLVIMLIEIVSYVFTDKKADMQKQPSIGVLTKKMF